MKIIRAMKRQRILIGVMVLVLLPALVVGAIQAQGPGPQGGDTPQDALGTAFTYQGRLGDGGSPTNGDYDLRFMLYDALEGGSQVGSTVILGDVTVTDGLFTVQLDFGDVFDGTALWLEAAVRPGSSTGSYTVLSPRQALTAAPYALYALDVAPHDHWGESWTGNGTGLTLSGGDVGLSGSGDSTGIYGVSGDYGRGVYSSGGYTGVGVYGEGNAMWGTGVYGTGDSFGVKGSSTNGYGGYFTSDSGTALFAEGNVVAAGDVAQSLGANGLVKAAVCAECGTDATVHRYFNTVNDHVSISSVIGGNCILDFDFDLSDRFWIAVAVGTGDTVSCAQKAGYNDQLDCWRTDHNGSAETGDIMVLVY